MGKGGTSWERLAHPMAWHTRMGRVVRGCEVKLASFIKNNPGCVSGTPRVDFRNLHGKRCRTVGSRALGTLCGSRSSSRRSRFYVSVSLREMLHNYVLRAPVICCGPSSSAPWKVEARPGLSGAFLAIAESADAIKDWPKASVCSNHVPPPPPHDSHTT